MQNKLQELTERLYQEGLSKGKAEGAEIVEKAKEEAALILSQAKAQAEEIIAKAEKDGAELKNKVESDIRMASEQALLATHRDIENLVASKISDEKVSAALREPEFIKEIIRAVAGKFNSEGTEGLEIILPESLKAQLEPFVSSELAAIAGKEIKAGFSKKINGGFTIGPKNGSYFVSLTEDSFKSLIGEYLRPVTRKFLFGE